MSEHVIRESETGRAAAGASPVADRSPEAFAAQFQAAYRSLWLIAAGILNDAALAEDVVQEAALVALGKLDQFEPGTSFTAWMGQVVRYVALNTARKRRKSLALSADERTIEPVDARATGTQDRELRMGAGGALPVDQEHFDDRVVGALAALSETARVCLLLRTVEGRDYAEIARMLAIPEGTAMSHVHRARRFLRERLSSAWEAEARREEGLA